MKCVIYTRVSTEEQGMTKAVEAQEDLCLKHIKANGWTYVETYEDRGFSAKDFDRPAIQKLIHAINEKKFDAIIMYRFDRLIRNNGEFHRVIELPLRKSGIQLISATEPIDINSPMGSLVFGLTMQISELERKTIAQRVKNNMRYLANLGKWQGGRIPMGYCLDSATHSLVPNEDEATIVKMIFHKFLETRSQKQVSDYLNSKGYRTRKEIGRDDQFKRISGNNKFTPGGITKILSNLVYIGHYKFGETFHDKFPPIVDSKVYYEVNDILGKKQRKIEVKPEVNSHNFLLKGHIRCMHCKSIMTSDFSGKKDKNGSPYLYYTCTSVKHGHDDRNCPLKSVPARAFEAVLKLSLSTLTKNEGLVDLISNELELQANKDIQPLLDAKKSHSIKLTDINNQALRLIEVLTLQNESMFHQQLKDKFEELEQQKKNLILEINQVNEELKFKKEFKIDRAAVGKTLNRFDLLIEQLSPEEQVKLFETLIESIELRLLPKNYKHDDQNDGVLKYSIRNKSLKAGVTLKHYQGISLNYDGFKKSSYQLKNGAFDEWP